MHEEYCPLLRDITGLQTVGLPVTGVSVPHFKPF